MAWGLIVRISGVDVFDIVVKANWARLRRHLPFGGTEEDGDVRGIDFRDARGNGSGFERVIDGGEKNRFSGNVNDGAAAGQVGDDFVFLCVEGESEEETSAELEEEDSQSVLTIRYLMDLWGEEGRLSSGALGGILADGLGGEGDCAKRRQAAALQRRFPSGAGSGKLRN